MAVCKNMAHGILVARPKPDFTGAARVCVDRYSLSLMIRFNLLIKINFNNRSQMKSIVRKLLIALAAISLMPIAGYCSDSPINSDTFDGYFSRYGNDGTPGSTTGKSLYIKLYPDQWVVLLYIPFPYAKSVAPETVHQVFAEVRSLVNGSAFVKNKFGLLDEAATANVEPYLIQNGRALFACGSSGTCAANFIDGNIQIIKQGILGEHIIEYVHVRE